eukprot:gene18400-22523_t
MPNAVLDPARWNAVLDKVKAELLTPVGMRSLSRDHPDYKARYDGDLRSRDAAYHQGTVWGWLIGPFIDAWLKVHPEDRSEAREWLKGLISHLDDACVGSLSEIFDAEEPRHRLNRPNNLFEMKTHGEDVSLEAHIADDEIPSIVEGFTQGPVEQPILRACGAGAF